MRGSSRRKNISNRLKSGSIFSLTYRRIAIVTVAALGFSFGSTASAAPYKWCAVYNFDIEIRECLFVTIEQCRASISGVGGYCEPNPFYAGPDGKPAKRTPKRDRG